MAACGLLAQYRGKYRRCAEKLVKQLPGLVWSDSASAPHHKPQGAIQTAPPSENPYIVRGVAKHKTLRHAAAHSSYIF